MRTLVQMTATPAPMRWPRPCGRFRSLPGGTWHNLIEPHSGATTVATTQRTEQLVRRMLDLNARQQVQGTDETLLIACIEACVECAHACTACADDSLAEPEVPQLIRSITLCLDCAVICEATRQVATRQTERDVGLVRAQVAACAEACRVCGAECERHAAHHEHHRICAEACHRCKAACARLAEALSA
jgi:hypothetical protein